MKVNEKNLYVSADNAQHRFFLQVVIRLTNLTDRVLTMTICSIRLILLTTMDAVCLKIANPQ